MNELEVISLVKEITAKQINGNVNDISTHSLLIEDLGFDSFGLLVLAHEIEKKFNLNIDDKELKNIMTIDDIIHLLLVSGKLNPRRSE